MTIGSSTQYGISSNYSVKPDDKSDSKNTEEKTDQDTQLSQDEKLLVSDLQSRDSEVRAHESAHQSGGAATGAASFTYQQGPDGKMYAIGGEVSISFEEGSIPQETIANAQAVIASALAPADPSSQDMAVASSATIMMMKAQQQLSRETQEEIVGKETYKNEANKENSNDITEKKAETDIPA